MPLLEDTFSAAPGDALKCAPGGVYATMVALWLHN